MRPTGSGVTRVARLWVGVARRCSLMPTPGTATVLLDEAHPLYMGGRFLFASRDWQDTWSIPTRSRIPRSGP